METENRTETHHGSTERVAWSVEVSDDTAGCPNASIQLHADEASARADFARRARYMHRGKSIRLVRSVTAEAWVSHTDTVESVSKPTLGG